MSQRELAIEFQVTGPAISQWESGLNSVPGPVLRLMELYERELSSSPSSSASSSWSRLRPELSSKLESFGSVLLAMGLFASAPRSSIGASIRERVFQKYVGIAARSRGLTMKWAQLAWSVAPVMNESQRETLRSFYSPGPIMSAAAATRVFLDEFGVSPREAFANWDPRPFASASLGQVHRATLRSGEEVAVKIQHPDAVARMNVDLETLEALESVALVFMRNQRPGVIHDEMRTRFMEECDYRLESERQRWMQKTFTSDPRIRIPAIIERWCSRRVLTSAYVEAENLDDFARRAPQDARNRAGEALWRYYHESLFTHGVFNADPNPGNFLFDREGVTLLDFGRVKALSPEFSAHLKRMLRAVIERNEDAARRSIVDIGYVKDPSRFDFSHILRLVWSWARPILVEEPFSFTPSHLRFSVKAYTKDTTRMEVDLHPDMAFIPSVFFGLGGLLTTLGAQVACRAVTLPILYPEGSAVPPPYTDDELRKFGLRVDGR